jgi:hypothetical protein
VGRTSRPLVHIRQAARSHVSRAAAGRALTVHAGRARFWPRSRLKIKKSFFIFHLVSN